ncbi:MAG: branched-chain amino acid transporter substrate-binding protein [Labilithrix sp.]|jgi:branched-chain amino acid transport system substrate-binding protein|nr:branched-chain amino acid transporter substrate-binding protein [Labilithrix sp.]
MKKALFLLATLSLVAAVSLQSALGATRASESAEAVPGITKNQIVIGGTFPLTGPASLYAPIPKGMDAYFKWANQRKGADGKLGVYGRKIVWKYYDDGYNPANTVQLTNQLILQDKVFAIVGTLGTEPNIPIRPLLNSRKVPHILVSTGASYWGLQYKQFPWTSGWQPDYIAEGIAYGRWIARNAPNAKIAVFFQNDDYGKDYLKGLKIGLAAKRTLIVSELGYEITDTSYASQIARQKASAADTWVLLTTPTPTVRAIATAKALAWKPDTIVINSVSNTDSVMQAAARSAGADFVNGAVSSSYTKNPTNPSYRNDAAVKRYRSIMSRFGGGADANNTFHYYGVAKASDVIRLLYLAGKNPTRASLMAATAKMNWVNPFLLKGITVKTGPQDRFPISQMKLIRYNNGTWSEFGPLIKGR